MFENVFILGRHMLKLFGSVPWYLQVIENSLEKYGVLELALSSSWEQINIQEFCMLFV